LKKINSIRLEATEKKNLKVIKSKANQRMKNASKVNEIPDSLRQHKPAVLPRPVSQRTSLIGTARGHTSAR
jgi:hypothetical protein